MEPHPILEKIPLHAQRGVIFRLGLIALACLQALVLHASANATQVLFSDDFTGQSGAPTHWMFGNSLTSGTADPGDTFAVVNNGTSDVLRLIDVAPVASPSIPIFHTIDPLDFTSTGNSVLQLEADVKINTNAADYRLGLYNAAGSYTATSSETYEMRISPGQSTNNVYLLTTSNTGVVDNIAATVPQTALQGTHHYMLEVDFSISTTTPTLRAYSDGVLIAKITASATGGFHPTGTDGKAVRIMSQSEFPGYTGAGASYDLDNVKLTALSILFKDDFTGQSGAPANWIFGNTLTSGTIDPGDTFAVVNNGTSDVLRFIDVAPVASPSIPIFHTINPVDFTSTGNSVIQLEADVKINANAPDYRLGLYNAVSPYTATWAKAYEMRIYPAQSTNNISLLTYSNTGVVDNIAVTTSTSSLQGSHHYTFRVNFTISGTTPIVQAYSDGVLLAQITASAAGGFHPTGTDGKAVRIMSQSEYSGYSGAGASYDLDNVVLTSLSGTSVPGPGLAQGPGSTVLKDGSSYRGIGVNYFDCFYRTLSASGSNDTSYDAGFALLAQNHIPFARFSACGFWPNDMHLYQTNPTEYFRRMDGVVASAAAHGIGLIPDLFWSLACVPDLVGESCNQWGNTNSATIAFMRQYVQDVVTRYRNSTTIWAWEFGSEYNSYADVPASVKANDRPPISVVNGTPSTRTANDDITTSMLATAFNEFAKTVRLYDPDRLITNGADIPCPTAWHFYTYPVESGTTWLTDTQPQLQTMMGLLAPDPVNLISVHTYGTDMARLGDVVTSATSIGKPLYVGEFQVDATDPTPSVTFNNFITALDQYNVPLASMSVFDLTAADLAVYPGALNISGTNSLSWQLDVLHTWNILHDPLVPTEVKKLYDPQVVAKSLVSQGDTARLQRVFAKALSSGTLTIAALGGSITQGALASSPTTRYAQLIVDWWMTKFPKATINFVNAGIGSTTSEYGSLRVQHDVLAYNPDFVVVDFAVNDTSGQDTAESYEGVVRQILNAPNQPALALLFMTRNDGVCAQAQQAAVGANYNLPMVSYHDAVWPLVSGSQIQWATVGGDYIHPNDVGHAYAAYLVTSMLETAFNAGGSTVVSSTLPAPVYSSIFENTLWLQAADLVPVAGSNNGWTYDAVKQAWVSSTVGSTIQFSIPGQKALLIDYHSNSAMGRASAQVDSFPAITSDAYYTGSSPYPETLSLTAAGQDLALGQHVVTITLSSQTSSTGHEYRILGLGGVGVSDFLGWQLANFTPTQRLDPSTSGLTANPAHDGIPNLLKYALNLESSKAENAGLPKQGSVTAGGKTYLTLTYTQEMGVADITYTVEVSGDLKTWTSGTSATSSTVTNNPDGLTQTVVARDLVPLSGSSPRFMRLRVTSL